VVCCYSVVPLPAWPVSAAPFVVIGWLLVVAIVMLVIYRGGRGRAGKPALAGVTMGEGGEEAIEELFLACDQLPRRTPD
jgi:hypothetical protein